MQILLGGSIKEGSQQAQSKVEEEGGKQDRSPDLYIEGGQQARLESATSCCNALKRVHFDRCLRAFDACTPTHPKHRSGVCVCGGVNEIRTLISARGRVRPVPEAYVPEPQAAQPDPVQPPVP